MHRTRSLKVHNCLKAVFRNPIVSPHLTKHQRVAWDLKILYLGIWSVLSTAFQDVLSLLFLPACVPVLVITLRKSNNISFHAHDLPSSFRFVHSPSHNLSSLHVCFVARLQYDSIQPRPSEYWCVASAHPTLCCNRCLAKPTIALYSHYRVYPSHYNTPHCMFVQCIVVRHSSNLALFEAVDDGRGSSQAAHATFTAADCRAYALPWRICLTPA